MRTSILSLSLLAVLSCGPATRPAAPPTPPAAPTTEPTAPTAPAEPAAAAAPAFPDDDFRKQQPTAGEVRPFTPPAIQQFRLKNGVEVYLVEQHALPTVSMSLVFPGGSVADPAGREGMHALCMDLLDEGTQKLDKVAFEEAVADLGSSVSSQAGIDEDSVRLASLTRNLDATLDLWADTLRRPGLRAADLDRLVKEQLAGLEQLKGSAMGIARRLYGEVLYGPRHAFGRVHTARSTNAVKLADCKKVAAGLRPAGARLYVVGDVTRAQIEEKLATRLAGWKGKARRAAKIGKPAPLPGRVYLVDVPGTAQSFVVVEQLGPPRQAPDYLATTLMAAVLGNPFSRLDMNLREDKGWSYGARGYYAYHRGDSLLFTYSSVQADKTGQAVAEMFKEIRGMVGADVSDAELARERDGAILGLPARFATSRDVLDTYRELVYYGLPLDYYKGFIPGLQAITKIDVRKAAEAHIAPDALRVLVVGDAGTVLPQLRRTAAAAQLGEVVVLDVDGNVVTAPAE